MLSSHLFFCLPLIAPCTALQNCLRLKMWPYHLSFCVFTMVRWSSCTPTASWYSNWILESGANFLVFHTVFVGNVQKSPIASHLLDPSFEFCCLCPALIGIKEGGNFTLMNNVNVEIKFKIFVLIHAAFYWLSVCFFKRILSELGFHLQIWIVMK